MEINKPQLNNQNFSFNPSIDDILIEELEVDLKSKPNVFSGYGLQEPVSAPIEKPKNPVKRLDTMDNKFLLQDEVNQVKNNNQINLPQKDVNPVWKAFKAVFKGFISKVPVVNYFILVDKQNKIKATIRDLSSINHNVDELMNMSFPREENFDKYKIISENLIKANNIHAQIIKEIQE